MARGRRSEKDNKMAVDLLKRGIYHGRRFAPWNQGISYPNLNDSGSAAYRRRLREGE